MVRLRARPQHRLLHLDEIADPGTLAQHRTGAQPRIGPDTRTFTHTRAFQMAERMDHRLVRHRYAGAEHDDGLARPVAARRGPVREQHRLARDPRRALPPRPRPPPLLPRPPTRNSGRTR